MSEPGSPDSCPMSPTSPPSLINTDSKYDQHKVREIYYSFLIGVDKRLHQMLLFYDFIYHCFYFLLVNSE
jgi:hypothetical protein